MAEAAEKLLANKFSRQNAALGAETTKFLRAAKVLIVGLRGAGVEIAKNCLLQGVGALTLYDPKPCAVADAGANFFISEADAGAPRDAVCRPRLQELNPDAVVAVADALDEALVGAMTCVVFTDGVNRDELARWNEFCRTRTAEEFDVRGVPRTVSKPVSFVWAFCAGLCMTVFVDHGDAFEVKDADGERPIVRLVESISSETRGLVRFAVPDGVPATSPPPDSLYEFSDVAGCEAGDAAAAATLGGASLNACPGFPYAKLPGDPANSFRIGDTTSLTPYQNGGLVTERKAPSTLSFQSLGKRLVAPGSPFDSGGLAMTDYTFMGAELQVHAALIGLMEFEAKNGRLPAANDEADADAILANARAYAEACRVLNAATAGQAKAADLEVDERVCRAYARHCAVELQPVATFCGGVVAQEVVKCAGKYTPLDGFLHFSFLEALPEPPPPLQDRAARGTRYDDLAAVFGHSFVERLGGLNYFLVGSGALGCEFVKNFALCGLCRGPSGGRLTIADADRIELSNLTRQFLFREHNVGFSKAIAAAAMAVEPGPRTCANAMNSNLNVTCHEAYVGPKTEATLFDDRFWEALDGICNALDNMEARFYVDATCVKFEKSLLESGTMGTSGNVDPVVPHKTKTYREGGNAAEGGGVPMCTLRNFPHLIDHCIEWARDKFAELFEKPANRVKKFVADPAGLVKELRRKLASSDAADVEAAAAEAELLAKALELATIADPAARRAACAQRAFEAFHALFRDQILDLTNAYPREARVTDKAGNDKGPFWSGHKKFPTAATYAASDEQWRFLVAATHLLAQMVGAQPRKEESDLNYAAGERDAAWASSVAAALAVPPYQAKKIDKTGIEPDAGEENAADDVAAARARGLDLAARLEAVDCAVLQGRVEPADFEKDDDDNFHIDFVASCANCRARNYAIAPTDFDKAKLTAGRIIPAIATTTAAVTGLVMLELFKVLLGKPATDLRTRQVGLALNYYPSFDADNLVTFSTKEVKTKPDASSLPPDAFDQRGEVKAEFWDVATQVAYPEKHSVWTKLEAPDGAEHWKLDALRTWLKDAHGLTLTAWNLPCGEVEDPETGEKKPVSARVYPVPEVVDLSKLPPLDLTKPKAMMALTRAGIRGGATMKYLNEWSKYKQLGALPTDLPPPEPSAADMTLREILQAKGKMALGHRTRVLLDGLSCSVSRPAPNAMDTDQTYDEDFDVEKLAPVLLKLNL
mmetsp:Transcript_12120/g.36413  ORF Transcript_12120/g.36413 Transcript_12120/m.36413 type:complete len:1221 (+) Transcript_12120:148-3810(+)